MFSNIITHDPYAYLGRALMGDPMPLYVPKEKMASEAAETASADSSFGEDGFGFDDFLDIINPLQHIPGISTLYRELTGDTISPGARMIGGTIFGGPIGFLASLINSAVEQATGSDIGQHVVALFSDDDGDAPAEAPVMVAENPAADRDTAEDAMTSAGAMAPEGGIYPASYTAAGSNAPFVAPFIHPAALTLPSKDEAESARDRVPTTTDAALQIARELEWKSGKPPILHQVKQAAAQDLTEEQLHLLLQSFRNQAPAPARAEAASAAYQQRSDAMQRAGAVAPASRESDRWE